MSQPNHHGALSDDDLVFERPRTAAAALGISIATFWRRVKDDPDFPALVALGPHSVGMVRGERRAYARKLIARRDAAHRKGNGHNGGEA
jgi:predicted DNA-binding transcriptional regulator AlpA